MKTEIKSPMGTQIINMEEVKFNEKFDDAIFKQPTKNKSNITFENR
jgi:hypothetical protein